MMASEDLPANPSSSGLPSKTSAAAGPSTMESGEVSQDVTASGVRCKAGRQLATMKLNDSKAGMEGLDTDKINQIIQEASRGSKFYNHKKQRQEKIDERIQRMLELKDSFPPEQVARAEAQMDTLAAQLERSRDLSRFIVHVDMDAFYAAVEIRDRPELRDVPMAVGSTGMLSTSNYAARKFGVRAAMPGFIGRKLCPQLVIIPCNFDKYRAASQVVQGVLARYDPNFSMMSLDEGYLDITEKVAAVMSEADGENSDRSEEDVAQELVRRLRAEICQETQLTVSAGIACNGMLAKICSDRNKPDGQFFLPRERDTVLDFLRELPVRKVCGIGNVLSQQLAALDVTCCGQLVERRALLRLLFSETAQLSLLRAGLGVREASSAREDDGHQKSVSTETTFTATADAAWLGDLLRELCAQLAEDLRRKALRGRTVTLKVKTSSFVVRSRAVTLAEPTAAASALLAATQPALARELAAGEPVRLLGVRASALVAAVETDGFRQATLTEMAGRGAATAAVRHVCPVCGQSAGSLVELSTHVERCLDGDGDGERRQGDGAASGVYTGDDGRWDVDSAAASGACWLAEDGVSSAADSVQPPSCAGDGREPSAVSDGSDGCSTAAADSAGGDSGITGAAPAGDGGATSAERPPIGSDPVNPRTEAAQGMDSAANSATGGAESGPAAALCPVCAQPLSDQLLQVNRHLDECLNQQLLSQLTDGGPVRRLKRPPAPHSAAPASKHKRIDSFFQVKK